MDLKFSTLTLPVPDFIYDGLKPYVEGSNKYIYQDSTLRLKLADLCGVNLENIFLGAGEDQLIMALNRVFGTHTVAFTPSYIEYGWNDLVGIHKVEKIDAIINGQFEIETNLDPNSSLIFLANPNNPFGKTSKSKIVELIESNPNAIVVIDECYISFEPELTVVDLIKEYENLVVLRSFSKSYGLAGFRIGYAVASEKILEQIKDHISYFNVANVSVGAAIIALEHQDYYDEVLGQIKANRSDLEEFFEASGFKILKSYINVVLLNFEDVVQADKFVQNLENQGIIVSARKNNNSNLGIPETCVRISVPYNKKDIQKLIDAVSSSI